jgi:transcriptional regulator GlxA family with amidase domain
MPPIRRILVLAVDGVQSLDVMGPIEVFCDAEELAPGTYRIDVVGPARDGAIRMSNGLKLGVDPLPAARASGGRARTRRSSTGSRGPPAAHGARRPSAPAPTCWRPPGC